MGILLSPGVDITVIDESFFIGAGQGTTPLMLIATRENKTSPGSAGTGSVGIAEGTLKENAGKLVEATSQRELLQLFGDPVFETVGGTPLHGNEINEYGLHAAFSFLGIANRVFLVRADVDLGELEATVFEPTGDPINGTFWLDLTQTIWGVFRSNANVVPGLAFDEQFVTVINDAALTGDTTYSAVGDFDGVFSTDTVSDVPLPSVGNAGDFSVVTFNNDNRVYEKILVVAPDTTENTRWYLVGSADWKAATPTTVTGSDGATVTAADEMTINGFSVGDTFSGTAVSDVISDINGASIPNIKAKDNGSGGLQIINTAGGDIVLVNVQGTPVEDLGLTATTFKGNELFYAPHTQIPGTSVLGDVYIKTTEPNGGAAYSIKRFDSSLGQFISEDSLFFTDDTTATATLGVNIAAGVLYVEYDVADDSTATHVIKRWVGTQTVSIIGTETSPTLTGGDEFKINGITVVVPNSSLADFVTVINSSGIPNIESSNIGDVLTISNTGAKEIIISDLGSGDTILADVGLTLGTFSNWAELVYEANVNEPSTDPDEGTLWYNTNFEVDILVSDGTEWFGYNNIYPDGDIILAGSEPIFKSDGLTALENNDLWIDTTELEDYPLIRRFNESTSEFELVDNTDQTTPFGIVFADARPDAGPDPITVGSEVFGAFSTDDTALRHSNFVDPDAVDPLTFPSGMLLFNTRFSTLNVKEFKPDYLTAFVGVEYTIGTKTFPNTTITADTKARFVTTSGNRVDGSPYMGRKAQRNMIVRAMADSIADNDDIRSEQVNFNLLAAPGYVELLDEMVTLNVDKKELAFIVGDTPARLRPNEVQEWATNALLAPSNSEEGLTTANTYVGLYYPWGLSTNTDGFEIMVPPSTMALRTLAFNDQVAFPWFAPAGFNRGLVTNATTVGFLTAEEEFQPILLNQGQRDVLQINKINPIAFITGRGLVVFGQKTLHPITSALDRVNVARLVNYLRFNLQQLSLPFLFEPNDQQTRDGIRLAFERFLGDLVGLRALDDFAVVSDLSNNSPVRIDRSELWVDVAIIPIKAVEFIFIPIRILNTGTELPV